MQKTNISIWQRPIAWDRVPSGTLAINFTEWMAFFRYLIPTLKYWLFDKSRLKHEHLERINEEGWREIEEIMERMLTILAPTDFTTVTLGRNDASPMPG